MNNNALLLASPLLLACAVCAPAPEEVSYPSETSISSLPADPVEVQLLPYFRGLRTVRLTSGSDTLSFLLDTGGGHTLLTMEAARVLGCVPFGRSVGHRMTGERVEFQWCTGIPLEIGGISLNHSEVAVFDLMALLPPDLPALDGVLSLKSFENRIVSIDLAGERLILESEVSAAARRAAMKTLVARRATGEDGSTLTVFLGARAEGAPIWLLVDNGNLAGTILSPHAVEQTGLRLPSSNDDENPGTLEAATLEVLGLEPRTESILVRDIIHDGVLGETFMREGVFMFDLRPKQPWAGFQKAASGST